MMTEGDDKGMGNIAEPRLMVGGDYMKVLRFEDLDRFVGRLCEGPISEEDLLDDADEEDLLDDADEAGFAWRRG